VLRGIFGPKKNEVIGGNGIMIGFICVSCTTCQIRGIIRMMTWTGHSGRMGNENA
jgi:hypothetical protein